MTAEPPAQTDFEKLATLFGRQSRVKFLPDLELRKGAGRKVEVLKSGEWVGMTIDEAAELWRKREMALYAAANDPFRHAHEPEVWDEIDWMICRLRVENPNVAVEILVMGGNGSGKSYYGVRCLMRCGVYNPAWLIWNFTTDELKSKTVMQQIAYKYLPVELRSTGKPRKRTLDEHIIFKNASGFTDNKIGFPSPPTAPGQPKQRGSVLQFRYHSAELDTLTGPRPQFAYSDEEITLAWVEAITNRLHTAAEKATANIPLFQELLAKKAANPAMKFPPNLVHLLFMGVHLITFTPEHGYNGVVHSFTKDATTVKEVDAELLPLKDDAGAFCGYEKVPKVQRCKLPHRAVFYMHPYENVHGGNWEGMKVAARTKTRENILWWAYGVAHRKSHVRFPTFGRATHVRPDSILSKMGTGTWYHLVDCSPGRNFFMGWYKINALDQTLIAREWPQEDDCIPGVGDPGPWTVEGQKLDGEKGHAQESFGFGLIQYYREIERVEKQLYLEDGGSEHGGKIKIEVRIIDSRGGSAPSLENSETTTLIIKFANLKDEDGNPIPLDFIPSGKASGAKDGDTGVDESVTLVEDLLSYDKEHTVIGQDGSATFNGSAPRLYILERCKAHIFSFSTWTNADGQKGACKDPCDCARYYAMADPYHREQREENPEESHGVY